MESSIVIYDACVLYPAPLRDLLMHLALTDQFSAKWTEQILSEWIYSLLNNRKDLTRARLEKTKAKMNASVIDPLVANYESIIPTLSLPDENDRHVLAAAIKADAIITMNLKDFPKKHLQEYGIEAIHPDDFIYDLAVTNTNLFLDTISRARSFLKNPPKTQDEYIKTLEKQSLPKTTKFMKKYKDVI